MEGLHLTTWLSNQRVVYIVLGASCVDSLKCQPELALLGLISSLQVLRLRTLKALIPRKDRLTAQLPA